MLVFSIVSLSKWLLDLWLVSWFAFSSSFISSFSNFFTCYFSLLLWRLDLLSDRSATKLALFFWSSLLILFLFLVSIIRLSRPLSEILSVFFIRLTRLVEMLLLLLSLRLEILLSRLLSTLFLSPFFGSSLRLIWYLCFLTIAVVLSFPNYVLPPTFFLSSKVFLLLLEDLGEGDTIFLPYFLWELFRFLFWDEACWETKLADLISIVLKTFEWLALELALFCFDALFLCPSSSLTILLFWAIILFCWLD